MAWPLFWQSALLALIIAAAAATVFRKASPQFRYLLWLLVPLRLLLPPSLYLPTSIGRWGGALLGNWFFGHGNTPTRLADFSVAAMSLPDQPDLIGARLAAAATHGPVSIYLAFCLLWLAGVLALLYLLARKLHHQRQMAIHSTSATDRIELMLERCRLQLGLPRPIPIRLSHGFTGPVVSGILRPVIYLPPQIIEDLSEEELQPVIIHELAHIRRHDCLVNWIQILLGIAYFFNPILWLVNR